MGTNGMDPTLIILIFLIVGFVFISLIVAFFLYGLIGATCQLHWAMEAGFLGVVFFIAAWFFLLPAMLGWAIVWAAWLGSLNRTSKIIPQTNLVEALLGITNALVDQTEAGYEFPL